MNKKQTFEIENYKWDKNGYRPRTVVELIYDDTGYVVHMKSYETEIRAVETEHNTGIHFDSCMEAFIQFDPENDMSYINYEINPNGATKCAKGKDRYDRVRFSPEEIDSWGIKTRINEDSWEIWINIPLDFILSQYPRYVHKEGAKIRANFYKCGNVEVHDHYGSWSPVDTEEPDFHFSEFFGEIIL